MLDFVVVEPHLPPAYTIEEQCIRGAAKDMKLDYFILKAIREQESGQNGKTSLNSNGTYDHGEFQINTVTIQDFKEFGITLSDVTNNTCLNIYTGALHLWRKIKETGDVWRGVAWYHSKRNVFGTPYAKKVYSRYTRLLRKFEKDLVVDESRGSRDSLKTAGR